MLLLLPKKKIRKLSSARLDGIVNKLTSAARLREEKSNGSPSRRCRSSPRWRGRTNVASATTVRRRPVALAPAVRICKDSVAPVKWSKLANYESAWPQYLLFRTLLWPQFQLSVRVLHLFSMSPLLLPTPRRESWLPSHPARRADKKAAMKSLVEDYYTMNPGNFLDAAIIFFNEF